MEDVEAVVQQQVEAYNRRDLDAFLACYAPDAKLYRPPHVLVCDGLVTMRERYAAMFAGSPELHATIVRRIVLGRFVVDREHVSGRLGEDLDAIATYEVVDGRIANVWFVSP